MKNFKQVKDVLDFGKELHAQITAYYERVREQSDQSRVQMLLDYLSRHGHNIEQALDRFEHDAQKAVLNTWLQYAPSAELDQVLKGCAVRPDMSVDELIKIAVDFDNAMIDLYREAAREVDEPVAREALENLIAMEDGEKRLTVYNAMMLREM
ncbi:MAG: hypothetical protein U1E83_10035 [Methylotetracoccus sp.]